MSGSTVLPVPGLVLLVGAAGSGKSSLAAAHFPPTDILSSDALRAAISGDEADQAASRAAFSALHREVAKRVRAGRLVVVDATNVRARHRRPLLIAARDARIPVSAIVLDLARDVVQARNAGRHRVVPSDVVDRQLGWLRETVDGDQLRDEGVDPIVVLSDPHAVDALRVRLRRRV